MFAFSSSFRADVAGFFGGGAVELRIADTASSFFGDA